MSAALCRNVHSHHMKIDYSPILLHRISSHPRWDFWSSLFLMSLFCILHTISYRDPHLRGSRQTDSLLCGEELHSQWNVFQRTILHPRTDRSTMKRQNGYYVGALWVCVAVLLTDPSNPSNQSNWKSNRLHINLSLSQHFMGHVIRLHVFRLLHHKLIILYLHRDSGVRIAYWVNNWTHRSRSATTISIAICCHYDVITERKLQYSETRHRWIFLWSANQSWLAPHVDWLGFHDDDAALEHKF